MSETEKPWTREDLAAIVERARSMVNDARLGELAAGITRALESLRLPSSRAPMALRGLPNESGHLCMELTPQILAMPTHLVLSPETARRFELRDLRVGKQTQLPGWASPMPLETFSVEYVKNDALTEIQAWKGDKCEPGMRITIDAVRRVEVDAPPLEIVEFRGLLWLECFW